MEERIKRSYDNLFLDFNKLTELLSTNNYSSKLSGNYLNLHILQATYQIKNVHQDEFFTNLINKIIKDFNLINCKLDLDLFVGFTQGASSIIHKDGYDVFLYNLYGETVYIVNKEKYILKQGDIIRINKGEIHQVIGLTPRIVFSLGVHNG
jgi:mannose-6-phosphate isomerase-like protein (cupin superfamily)